MDLSSWLLIISIGNSFLLVETVISSAYRVYVQPTLLQKLLNLLSKESRIKFVITGEQGLPWGNLS